MKGQDLFVAVGLDLYGPLAYGELAARLGLSTSETHAATARLGVAMLVSPERRVVGRNLLEFIVHGLRYVFPVEPGRPSLGVPTCDRAPGVGDVLPPLDPPWVWPSPEGTLRGSSIEPLFSSVPAAALRDPELHRRLALLDAIRGGGPRDRKIATAQWEAILR